MVILLRVLWVSCFCYTIVSALYWQWPDERVEGSISKTKDTDSQVALIQPLNTESKDVPTTEREVITEWYAAKGTNLVAPMSDTEFLAELELALPNNSYWLLAAPTEDGALLESRIDGENEREKRAGLIQAGLASETDIVNHFEFLRQTSEDFIVFSEFVINHYANHLPEHAIQMHKLSIKLHRSRLADMTDQKAQAFSVLERNLQRKQAWLEDPVAFEKKLAAERDAAMASLVSDQ